MHQEMQESLQSSPMINMLLHQNLLPSFVISYENQIVSLCHVPCINLLLCFLGAHSCHTAIFSTLGIKNDLQIHIIGTLWHISHQSNI